MPYETPDFIHMPNPEHPEDDFRRDNKGNANIVGTTNFGAGIQARMGLLKSTGKTAPFGFLFDKNKWTSFDANKWLEKYKGSDYTFDNNENFEITDDGMFITAKVTKLNEKFEDDRVIVGVDIPEGVDIPVRDLHSKGYSEVVGFTNSDDISFDQNGVMNVRWNVISDDLQKLVKSARHPKTLFQYSPELSDPIRDGNNRSGMLSGIAITPDPAWVGSGTTAIYFEKLTPDGSGEINDEIRSPASGYANEAKNDKADKELYDIKNKEANNVADKEVMELSYENKDLKSQIEDFKKAQKKSKDQLEAFEKKRKDEKEKFEKEIKDISAERDDFKEKFEQKEKDYADLKKDNDEAQKTISKFQDETKKSKVDEVFSLGVKIGMYKEDEKDAKVKELFEVSEERLEEKKENFDFMASRIAKNDVPGVKSGHGQTDKKSEKENFESLF